MNRKNLFLLMMLVSLSAQAAPFQFTGGSTTTVTPGVQAGVTVSSAPVQGMGRPAGAATGTTVPGAFVPGKAPGPVAQNPGNTDANKKSEEALKKLIEISRKHYADYYKSVRESGQSEGTYWSKGGKSKTAEYDRQKAPYYSQLTKEDRKKFFEETGKMTKEEMKKNGLKNPEEKQKEKDSQEAVEKLIKIAQDFYKDDYKNLSNPKYESSEERKRKSDAFKKQEESYFQKMSQEDKNKYIEKRTEEKIRLAEEAKQMGEAKKKAVEEAKLVELEEKTLKKLKEKSPELLKKIEQLDEEYIEKIYKMSHEYADRGFFSKKKDPKDQMEALAKELAKKVSGYRDELEAVIPKELQRDPKNPEKTERFREKSYAITSELKEKSSDRLKEILKEKQKKYPKAASGKEGHEGFAPGWSTLKYRNSIGMTTPKGGTPTKNGMVPQTSKEKPSQEWKKNWQPSKEASKELAVLKERLRNKPVGK